MSSMRRLLAVIAIALGLAPQVAHALPAGSGARDPSIVIGMVATLSGPGAMVGQDLVDGFNLALRQLGGRFANQEVRLVVADDRGQPDVAVQQVNRLLGRERLDMVLTGVAPSSLAAFAPSLFEARLFVLNLDQAPAGAAGAQCSPWLFDLAAPVDGFNEALGQYLTAEKVRRLVVVAPDIPLVADHLAALKRTYLGEVAEVLVAKPGAAVYDREIDRIREIKPDAVYSLLAGGTGVAFVRAWGASGLKGELPFFPLPSVLERPMLPAMGDAALDLLSIGTWSPDLDSIPNKRLVTDFEAEFGRPATIWATQGCDAAFLLDSALKATNGKTGDSEALRTALRRADFVSVRGGFRFNTNHFPILSYYLRKVVKDSKGRLTHELHGTVLKDWHDRHAAQCPMRWVEEVPPALPAKKP
jgi:branched-chain amino acid transport system substrate-binding protein